MISTAQQAARLVLQIQQLCRDKWKKKGDRADGPHMVGSFPTRPCHATFLLQCTQDPRGVFDIKFFSLVGAPRAQRNAIHK